MRHYKEPMKVTIAAPARRTGHYNFQGGKCTHDNRPKRLRTRSAQHRAAIREQ
jgi:hypothetical protein